MSRLAATAAGYHRATSYRRHRLSPHSLDWAHQPMPVKPYPRLPRRSLDGHVRLPQIDYYRLVQSGLAPGSGPTPPADVQTIATLLYLTHAVTARRVHAGQTFSFRSVASAGALYPFELYLSVNQVDGLDPGLYHYDPLSFSLSTLRRGGLPLIQPVDRDVAATVTISGILFRSAWKYRSRAYRYVLLDAGHLLENLRLAVAALGRSCSIHLDFNDDQAATLLGLDTRQEVCLACVHLSGDTPHGNPARDDAGVHPLPANICQASTVSERVVTYDEILQIHRAGSAGGQKPGDIDIPPGRPGAQPDRWIDMDVPDAALPADYVRVLEQRRSRRNFVAAPVSRDEFMTYMGLLADAMGPLSGMPAVCRSALTVGFLAGGDLPVPPGFYLLDGRGRRMGQVLDGRLTRAMATASLDQMWLQHAGLHLLFITDPALLDRTWGARGYRYAMIEAGRLGQQAYLAATALGWGACGIGAIYDHEAADLLGLTNGGALIYLIGVGPVKTR
jgi:SagB-type dehydrogenase family enzyme